MATVGGKFVEFLFIPKYPQEYAKCLTVFVEARLDCRHSMLTITVSNHMEWRFVEL